MQPGRSITDVATPPAATRGRMRLARIDALGLLLIVVLLPSAATLPAAILPAPDEDTSGLASLGTSRPIAVGSVIDSAPPEGWRRTVRGWENTSNWPSLPKPLGELIQIQQAREPQWLQSMLAKVRRMPPLVFATLQVVAIFTIVSVSNHNSRNH